MSESTGTTAGEGLVVEGLRAGYDGSACYVKRSGQKRRCDGVVLCRWSLRCFYPGQ